MPDHAGAGVVSVPELLASTGSNLNLSGNSLFDAPKLASMTADAMRYIIVNESSVLDAPLLASLMNTRLSAGNGGSLVLPLLTEFSFDASCGDQIISAYGVRQSDGEPSLVSLPALESMMTMRKIDIAAIEAARRG